MLQLVDCGLQLIPVYKKLRTVFDCIKGIYDVIEEAKTLTNKEEVTSRDIISLTLSTMSTTATCMDIKSEGAGDKNKTREQKRAKLVDEIAKALTDISNSVEKGNLGWTKSISDLAFELAKYYGYDYDDFKELFCPLKLITMRLRLCSSREQACSLGKELEKQFEPSYIQEFRQNLTYGILKQMVVMGLQKELYGDVEWLNSDSRELGLFMTKFESLRDENDAFQQKDIDELIASKPENITKEQVKAFVQRWNDTLDNKDTDNKVNIKNVFSYGELSQRVDSVVSSLGYTGIDECYEKAYEKCLAQAKEQQSSVCSSITLQFTQKMVMTRQAFRNPYRIQRK